MKIRNKSFDFIICSISCITVIWCAVESFMFGSSTPRVIDTLIALFVTALLYILFKECKLVYSTKIHKFIVCACFIFAGEVIKEFVTGGDVTFFLYVFFVFMSLKNLVPSNNDNSES